MFDDTQYMQRVLKLAGRGRGKTFPNPMVGAVIVKKGRIIGQGYHKKAGSAHAEIEAIESAKGSEQGSTMYVNLEPCNHHGKTPPCVDAIIKAGIAKVVCSTLDPNPKVAGDGLAQLKKAGIKISVGMLGEEARILNEQFFTFHTQKRPFIAIKYAASLDGKLATDGGDSQWITNEAARAAGRKLRSQHQAILVGINTVLADNPYLGTGLRIVLGDQTKIPKNWQVLRDNNVLVFAGPLPKLMDALYKMNIVSVFVEGGAHTIASFVDQKLVDKVYGFYAPILIGGHDKVADSLFLQQPKIRRLGNNFMIEGTV